MNRNLCSLMLKQVVVSDRENLMGNKIRQIRGAPKCLQIHLLHEHRLQHDGVPVHLAADVMIAADHSDGL